MKYMLKAPKASDATTYGIRSVLSFQVTPIA